MDNRRKSPTRASNALVRARVKAIGGSAADGHSTGHARHTALRSTSELAAFAGELLSKKDLTP